MQLIITQITTVNTIERLSVFYEAKRKMEKITYLTFICTKIFLFILYGDTEIAGVFV